MLKLLCILSLLFSPYASSATDSLEKELANALEQSIKDTTEEDKTLSSDSSDQKDSREEPTEHPQHHAPEESGDQIVNEEESVDPSFLNKAHPTDTSENPQSMNIEKDEESSSDDFRTNKSNFKKLAKLQGLNKITTDISNLRIPVNSSLRFGNLIIRVNACWQAPQELKPENKILLRISEIVPGDAVEKDIFYGWMLSSSPAVSSISHPVYDIIAISCSD